MTILVCNCIQVWIYQVCWMVTTRIQKGPANIGSFSNVKHEKMMGYFSGKTPLPAPTPTTSNEQWDFMLSFTFSCEC
jgi:hypothetical protein